MQEALPDAKCATLVLAPIQSQEQLVVRPARTGSPTRIHPPQRRVQAAKSARTALVARRFAFTAWLVILIRTITLRPRVRVVVGGRMHRLDLVDRVRRAQQVGVITTTIQAQLALPVLSANMPQVEAQHAPAA